MSTVSSPDVPAAGIESDSLSEPEPLILHGPPRSRPQWWSRGLRAYAFDAFLVLSNFLLSLPGHRFRELVLRRIVGFNIGVDIAVQRRLRVLGRGGVTIGDRCQINRDVTLDGRGGITIGSDVNISPEVTVVAGDHDPNSPTFESRDRPVVISDRVWLATRAFVLGGTHIGEGALVAAGAVVHGVVPPWSIVAGNPAKVIGQRSPDAQATTGPAYRRFLH
jgi:acetyltransferase-like isoleucine patch superfamily enzyme